MLKIRLKRFGRKKRPFYRIIIIDSKKKRDGRAIKEVGFYNPIEKTHYIDIEQVNKKINEGAQITTTIENLIKNNYK